VERLQERYDINPGDTTKDDRLSLLTARCVGACGLAPAIVVDGDVLGKLDSETLIEKLEELT
jgi:bidirectional [NiFe] hydrogenase diaphorase subunit